MIVNLKAPMASLKSLDGKIILLWFLLVPLAAITQVINTGRYDNGFIGIDSNRHIVTGYFSDFRGLDSKTHRPQFSCEFLFAGKITNSYESEIECWHPDLVKRSRGKLQLVKKILRLSMNEDIGGCINVVGLDPETNNIEIFLSLESPAKYISIRMTSSGKVPIYSHADTLSPVLDYLKKGTVVRVVDIKGGIDKIVYGNKNLFGWIRESSLVPLPDIK